MTRRQVLAALIGLASASITRALAAQEQQRYYVTGFVKSPGSYLYEEGLTVRQGIANAGGLTDQGSSRGVVIKRQVDGRAVEVDVTLSSPVQPNDTIFVRRRLA
jgi:protein involved in polysaccharide export with SLBB domain